MTYVILGLLLIAPRTQYELIKAFESGVSLFYSASSGSIKRALDTLVQRSWIEVAHTETDSRRRKRYRVTPAGREAFVGWMDGDITGTDLETAVLSRMFFLGLLDADTRASVQSRLIERIDGDLRRLDALATGLASVEVPDERRDIAEFQRATLDYGRASHRFALDWFRTRFPSA